MKKIFISLFLVLILSIGLYFTFQVKNAKFQGNSNCLDESALQNKVNNKNIILLNTKKLKEEILKQSTCIENLAISKKYPNTIIFLVSEKEAIAKIDSSQYSVTESGLIIDESSSMQKPKIFLPQGAQITLGQIIQDPAVLYALKLVKYLEKSDFMAANVRITEQGDIAIYSRQEAVAVFTKERSPESQVDSLQSIIAKAKIDPSKIAKIDLRFDKPVLVYKTQ